MLKCAKDQHTGFTLVEISIVIVIIGLVIGGVLVGRDLIVAAEQRRIIAQIEGYQTAVHTFRSKYNGLAGDLANGTTLGFAGNGNGDGCITVCYPELSDTALNDFSFAPAYPELSLFWNMLSASNLIAGRYDGLAGVVATNTIGRTIPALATNPNIGLLAYYGKRSTNYPGPGDAQKHFLSMTINADNVGLWFDRTSANFPTGIGVSMASNIDLKMDDGFPGSGKVMVAASVDGFFDQVAMDGSADITGATLGSEFCTYLNSSLSGGSRWLYNLTNARNNCYMRFEAGF